MNVKDAINKIKSFLSEEVTSIEMTDVKTQDGTILSFDKLEIGAELFVVDANGRTPAPDVEYVLEDGTTISAVGGKIEEISAPEMPIEAPEEMPVAEMPEVGMEVVATELSIEELACKVKKLEEDNLALAEVVAQLAESFSMKNFTEEVKASTIEKVEAQLSQIERKPLNKMNNDLNTIFKNMYK